MPIGCPGSATLARDNPRQPLPPQVAAHSSSSSAGPKLLDRACGTGLKPVATVGTDGTVAG